MIFKYSPRCITDPAIAIFLVQAVRRLFAALLFTLAALAGTNALARSVLDLDAQHQPVALQDWGDYGIDTTGQLTPQQIAASPDIKWQATNRHTIYPVKTGQALWVRFTVPPAPDVERWYLEVPYPSINRVSLYTYDEAGQWTEQKAGDTVPVSKWPVPNRDPLMPIVVSAEVPSNYLLRLDNGHSFSAPLQFVSESYFNRSEQRISLILGIFFGLAGLAAVISAISAISLRDPAYGFYAVSVTITALTQATFTGIAGLHLWPQWARWNDLSTYILPMLDLSAALMFISAAMSLPERSLRLHRTMTAVALFGVLVAAGLSLAPLEQRMGLFTTYLFLPQLLGLYALAWAWRHGDRFAPWLMLATAPVVASGAYMMARNVGLVPISFMTQYGAQIGVAIELPIIMVILMLRSQQRRENIRRVQGLDRVDPATGLINGHIFAERLMRMIARSGRLRHESAVMLIDIVNSDQIQRDFGRKAAEELPLRVAERLLSTAREIDGAARISERRFGMLVEGPFSAEDAASLGPRIVARCLMPYKGMHVDCVAQVRVAYALVPQQGSNAQDVLTRLEERLVSASGDDRKAVFVLGETTPPKRPRSRPVPEKAPTPG